MQQKTINLFNSPIPQLTTSKFGQEQYRDSSSLLHNLALSPRQIASIAREELEKLVLDKSIALETKKVAK